MGETINERVKRCRRLADLTQSQTAERMGMKCSTYSQMERNGNISANRLLQLAQIFGVDPDLLLNGEAKDEKNEIADAISNTQKPETQSFRQEVVDFTTVFVPTNNEVNIIKIIRNLPKDKRDDIISYIEKAYKESRDKK